MSTHPFFYYDGNCNDPNAELEIKDNFIRLLGPTNLCDGGTGCNQDTVKVYCGNVTVAERRRRRSTTMEVC